MLCPKCGNENRSGAAFCTSCGAAIAEDASKKATASNPPKVTQATQATQATAQPEFATTEANATTHVYVQGGPNIQKNGLGTAGFVLALLGLFLSWIPIFGWFMWFLGALFSIIGDFKQPRGLAIAGTVISFIDLIILIMIASAATGFFAFAH
ncbi:MAG: zinc ribbon domain-containing protein [Raoultibacter sp.]